MTVTKKRKKKKETQQQTEWITHCLMSRWFTEM